MHLYSLFWSRNEVNAPENNVRIPYVRSHVAAMDHPRSRVSDLHRRLVDTAVDQCHGRDIHDLRTEDEDCHIFYVFPQRLHRTTRCTVAMETSLPNHRPLTHQHQRPSQAAFTLIRGVRSIPCPCKALPKGVGTAGARRGGARPFSAESTGARVFFRPRNNMPSFKFYQLVAHSFAQRQFTRRN